MTLLLFKPPIPDEGPGRREDRRREKMFLEHYSWLMECALNITHGQREHAEDLVHDVFLQFVHKDTNIPSIVDIRGYLNGILRNLHLLQLRRTTRHPLQSLSLFDHDSALVGMRIWNSVEQLQSADLLVRACDFACYRKETAVTASILILRFFHGYYPGEIALLLRARRRAVDQWIQRGRIETKQYIESPYPLPENGRNEQKMPRAATAIAFLRRLRERVFGSCSTDCSVLADNPTEPGLKELAHLVSCQACLEHRSRKMGLSHVAERMADDISDRNDGRPQGGSGGAGEILPLGSRRKPSKHTILRKVYARKKELFEHRPKEISLAFDGTLRATLLVSGPTNTLNLSLDSKEVPNSIAILSEQEFNFLILDHDDLTSSERRVHRLPLSDDRILHVTVIPETLGPSIQVVYEDPQFLATTNSLEDEEPQAVVMADRILSFPSERTNSATDPRPEWRTALFDQIRSFVPAMNPLLTSAILLGLASVLCLVFWLRSSAPPTAAELLQHAQKAELGTVATNRPGVIYEKVAIRTQRRTIKRTIYRDSQGIRHPRRQRLSPEDEQLKSMLASAGVSWDTPLSVAEFADWRYRSGTTRDLVTRPSPHLLTLTTTPRSNGAVQWESLTVRDTDFHAVERTVELRGSGIVEIAELNYDVLPWGAVNQDWFEPLSGQTAMDAPGILPALAAHVPHVLSNLELDEAELEARLALNQLHADAGERIRLARRAQGIEIKGVVDTDARKHELVARLSQLPHVQTSILSVEELDNQPQSVPSLDVKQPLKVYSVEAQSSPLEQYLREKNQSLDQLALISQNLLDGALKVQQGQVHFSELQPRFDEADRLPVDMQGKLAELSRNYLTTIIAGLDSNSRALRSLDFEDAGPPPAESVLTDDLSQQIHRYQELCEELITSGTGRTRPAAEIARGLMSESERIRLRVIQLSAAVPRAHD